ncbi:acyl-CoA thioesterase [Stappia sp.]|uniref:acyl-CoA thioesterase n=1 Tax=Stappia sp. TaxID=1870903 RepID=UPI003A9A3F2C
MGDAPDLDDYPVRSTDKLRYCDTDRQGHINNAVFSTFLETGRVDMLYAGEDSVAQPGANFVIARLELDFLAEGKWPGSVEIGSAVERIGRSSLTLDQLICQDRRPIARARTVIVLMNDETRKSQPLSEEALTKLGRFMKAAPRA